MSILRVENGAVLTVATATDETLNIGDGSSFFINSIWIKTDGGTGNCAIQAVDSGAVYRTAINDDFNATKIREFYNFPGQGWQVSSLRVAPTGPSVTATVLINGFGDPRNISDLVFPFEE